MLLHGLSFQSLEPLRKSLQIVSQPNTTNSGWRYHHASLGKFVGHPDLTQSWLVHRQFHDRLLDVLFNPVLDAGLTPTDFLQSQLTALVVHLLEAVEAVPRVAHHLAGLRNAAQHLRQVKQTHLVLDDLLIRVH
jgi:hypothetical protein